MRQSSHFRQQGFTLIELMVTIAVLAIIMGVAIPSFTDQIRNNRSLTFGDEFSAALNFSRSEAVKRGRMVSICASNDQGTDCGDDWVNGWIAFIDRDPGGDTGDDPSIDDQNTDILRYWDSQDDGMSLEVTSDGDSVSFVRFTGMGTLARIANNAEPVRSVAKHVDCTGNAARAVDISVSGSVHLRRLDC